ncbi:MAG: ATP-binding protein [Deltaproteobacteria bacterium]|nr:ATP-binding protein [Deltaproteobacteria bacterium]
MRELIVISGKGGTGKTSITASFAALAGKSVIADCDVDAADLHLVLSPRVIERHDFRAGNRAIIRQSDCIQCGSCLCCRFDAVKIEKLATGEERYFIEPFSCEGCGLCVRLCPTQAIDFPEQLCGEWMVSETRFGPMVHAQLGIAAENSGKLVTTVRQQARRLAEENHIDLIVVDGPPGIGCPVIASITGATSVLTVTEPTLSGRHDLKRVLTLTRHFDIPAMVCVNKWDLNPEITELIEQDALQSGAQIVGRICYDPEVTRAQIEAQASVERQGPASQQINDLWHNVVSHLQNARGGGQDTASTAANSRASEN